MGRDHGGLAGDVPGWAARVHLGRAVGRAAGRAQLGHGLFRPVYGFISEFIGRRKTMIFAYSGNVVFQLLTYAAGAAHNAPFFVICAIISGGLSGANFPMTAAMTADYYGETNNAINYGTIYIWKALGGSFAGGIAALIMTGTLYGTASFHYLRGFIFGATLGALAAIVVGFLCRPPTVEQMETAVRRASKEVTAPATTATA
jgi:MFS transporter, OFA family, oxalate/formate antiporter